MSEDNKNHFPHLLEALPKVGDATIQTLELLWRAAPEQVEEIDSLFAAGVQARLAEGQAPTLGVMYNVLQIPKEVLEQIWLLAHAAWHDLEQFCKLKEDPSTKVERKLVADAIAAATKLSEGDRSGWPKEVPAFRSLNEGVVSKAIRELFAMATAWALMHEMCHAKFYDAKDRPENLIDEEMMCDEYAADFLLSRIDRYTELTGEANDKVRGKRAMGALVGLIYVARMSNEIKNSATHPHVRDRIKLLFEKIGDEPTARFWSFAIAMLWGLRPDIAFAPVTLENPSERDLANFALKEAFQEQ